MASRNWILLSCLVFLTLSVGSSRAEDWEAFQDDITDDGGQALEENEDDGGEQTLDPRLFLILPTGAGNLLNLNTTGALLALLGTAALLSALGFLIYHIVSNKLMMKGQTTYGSGGYSSYGSSGTGGFSTGGFGTGSGSHYGYARSSDAPMDWDSLKILDYISMMEEMWRKLDVHDTGCQKRILCEIHQNEKALGPAASKIVNAFGYARYLSVLNIPDALKNMIDDYQDAADKGRSLQDKECKDVFDSCDFSVKETFLKKLKSHSE